MLYKMFSPIAEVNIYPVRLRMHIILATHMLTGFVYTI